MGAGRRGFGVKRASVLEAARELFLRDGFAATSMDAITSRAGVSKATVYAYFPSKDDLFATLVRETAAPLLGGLPPLDPAGEIEPQLRRYLLAIRAVAFTIGHAWDRLGIAEGGRHPEVGRLLYATGPARVQAALAEFFALAGRSRPEAAAEMLLAVTMVAPMFRVLMGVQDMADLSAGLDDAIRAVLRAHPPAGE